MRSLRKDPLVVSSRQVRALLVRLAALVAALAVVTGTWLAGQRYFYCAPMERVALHECCASGADDHGRDDEAAIGELPHRCCEERLFDVGDRGATPAPFAVAPAPCLAVVAILSTLTPGEAPSGARATHDTRAGPPRAGPLAWRTPIDVSLS